MSRILVINEDPSVLGLVSNILQDLGHHVLLASNDEEAMFLLMIWQSVDVIMSQIVMSDRKGFDLMAKIVKHGQEQTSCLAESRMATGDGGHIFNGTLVSSMFSRLGVREVASNPRYHLALRRKLKLIAGGA